MVGAHRYGQTSPFVTLDLTPPIHFFSYSNPFSWEVHIQVMMIVQMRTSIMGEVFDGEIYQLWVGGQLGIMKTIKSILFALNNLEEGDAFFFSFSC